MKPLLLAGVALGAFVASSDAQAQFLNNAPAPAPAFSWTGCYVGANAGGGVSQVTSSDVPPNSIIGGAAQTNGAGPLAGGQLGCNYEISSFVFGIEGEGDWADISGNSYDPFFSGKNVQTIHARTDYLADVSGRVGYGDGNWLFYAKGGVAFTRSNYNYTYVDNFFAEATPYGGGQSRTGWVVGGGIEWALWQNWSVKAEYLHYGFGSENLLVTAQGTQCFVCGTSFTSRISQSDDTFKLGLNYRFTGF